MKTAVLTVIYPGADVFVHEFVASLQAQTSLEFTLLVVNDGVKGVQKLFSNVPFEVVVEDAKGTPARIRKKGIEWAELLGFECIVFADIDDFFDSNRIELSVSLLRQAPVVFNELILFGSHILGQPAILGKRFLNGSLLREPSIRRCNFLGLSNTAARVLPLSRAAQMTSDDVIAFDWALYTRLLHGGVAALYINGTRTFYRQHNNNTAGLGVLSDIDIIRGVGVVAKHYNAVKDLNSEYMELAGSFTELKRAVENDPGFAFKYASKVREHLPGSPIWWEHIRTRQELFL